jgi:hypothetical protein
MRSALIVCALLIIGCKQREDPARPALSIASPVDFTVVQRQTVAVPGSVGELLLTIDDITRGQVMAGLAWQDGKALVARRSLREGENIKFEVGGQTYTLVLKKLRNVVVGNDTATFRVLSGDVDAQSRSVEDAKIEQLIQSLLKAGPAVFIRNSHEHTPAEAVAHMRKKWKWKRAEIATAEDFIKNIGSRSSQTRKPYVIKWPDGRILSSEEWFEQQLKTLERQPE